MRVFLDLFFVNPERVPVDLPQCENERGNNAWMRESHVVNDEFDGKVVGFLERALAVYDGMGLVEEVWLELSVRSDVRSPSLHLPAAALSLLGQMNASLSVNM
jgi:hypothetical protein